MLLGTAALAVVVVKEGKKAVSVDGLACRDVAEWEAWWACVSSRGGVGRPVGKSLWAAMEAWRCTASTILLLFYDTENSANTRTLLMVEFYGLFFIITLTVLAHCYT